MNKVVLLDTGRTVTSEFTGVTRRVGRPRRVGPCLLRRHHGVPLQQGGPTARRSSRRTVGPTAARRPPPRAIWRQLHLDRGGEASGSQPFLVEVTPSWNLKRSDATNKDLGSTIRRRQYCITGPTRQVARFAPARRLCSSLRRPEFGLNAAIRPARVRFARGDRHGSHPDQRDVGSPNMRA